MIIFPKKADVLCLGGFLLGDFFSTRLVGGFLKEGSRATELLLESILEF